MNTIHGFRLGSEVANLIMFVRSEYRAKYNIDYTLMRVGKNRFKVRPGPHSDYGISYVLRSAPQFKVKIEE
jgi:hypothetical protein